MSRKGKQREVDIKQEDVLQAVAGKRWLDSKTASLNINQSENTFSK